MKNFLTKTLKKLKKKEKLSNVDTALEPTVKTQTSAGFSSLHNFFVKYCEANLFFVLKHKVVRVLDLQLKHKNLCF